MTGVDVVELSGLVPILERQLACRAPLWHSGDVNSIAISAKNDNLGHFDHQVALFL